ncbi:TetR/AcrR family transcriptional regulator [Nocardia sp. NBC_01388]|uniref:TetR/AcrR family transcriptional regulator n=1 Tax=Nocardia sp. NBC_01388 TaxID=2903596 RepID=UPI00324410CE
MSTSPTDEPAWKQRAVERSLRTAKLRAELRVQRFLDAARAIIIENGTIDLTVQEVVDRSRQSLRSFYLQFDGKHELLLALFEDALNQSAEQIRVDTADTALPLDRLRMAVELLFERCRPDPETRRPLFTDFAPQLLATHPAQVKIAHAGLLTLFTDLMTQAQAAGDVRADITPRRMAALVMQTVMFTAQSPGNPDRNGPQAITAAEVWNLCARGVARQE